MMDDEKMVVERKKDLICMHNKSSTPNAHGLFNRSPSDLEVNET